MSDYTSQDRASRDARYGGVIADVVSEDLPRMTKLLAGINGGVYKAVGSAIKRAANSAKTTAKKSVTQEYTISQSEFLHETRNINHFVKEGNGEVSVEVGFAGYVIPLIKFNTHVGNDGRIVTQVKRSSAAQTLDNAFSAQMGHHKGIYERVGIKRFPVKEFYGPATPEMMYSNETVVDAIEDKMVEVYQKRIDHEVLRILNGWGG